MLPIVPIFSLMGAVSYGAYVVLAWSLAIFIGLHITDGIILSRGYFEQQDQED